MLRQRAMVWRLRLHRVIRRVLVPMYNIKKIAMFIAKPLLVLRARAWCVTHQQFLITCPRPLVVGAASAQGLLEHQQRRDGLKEHQQRLEQRRDTNNGGKIVWSSPTILVVKSSTPCCWCSQRTAPSGTPTTA